MLSTLDLLYISLTIATIIITVVLLVMGIQAMRILSHIQRIAEGVEEVSALLNKIAEIVLPGLERTAKRLDGVERTLGHYIDKGIDKLTER